MYKMKVLPEEKIKAVEAYLGGTGSQKSWSEKFGVHHSMECYTKSTVNSFSQSDRKKYQMNELPLELYRLSKA